jgi:hypothetical protein
MGEKTKAYTILIGKPEGRRPLGKRGVDGRIITLKLVLGKCDLRVWNRFIWLRIWTLCGLLWAR